MMLMSMYKFLSLVEELYSLSKTKSKCQTLYKNNIQMIQLTTSLFLLIFKTI